MPSTTLNGVDLFYEVHGSGQGSGTPLMLVAGLASDSQSWQPVLEQLARQHPVIVLDNRGVGRTNPQEAEAGIGQLADDCVALIRHLDLPPVSLLGHSMGGFVALDCAIRHPGHVRNLILVGTSARNSDRNNALFRDWAAYLGSGMDPEHWFRNIFYWIFTERFFTDPDALNEALQFAIDYPYPQSRTGFENQVDAIRAFDCLDGLSGIAAKTLVLCGKEDLLFPPDESMAVLRAIPDAVFHLVEHAAHAVHMENPKDFADRVLDFLGD